jgi:hypothetical protein
MLEYESRYRPSAQAVLEIPSLKRRIQKVFEDDIDKNESYG